MRYWTILMLGFSFLGMKNGIAQDLSSHQWEDRILIVKTKDSKNQVYQQQIKELKKNIDGLVERKIVVYQVHNQEYKKGFSNDNSWKVIKGNRRKKHFEISNSDFEIILIGLDGGVKLKQSDFLDMDKLFAKIDSMPMRMWEMRGKN